MGLVFSISYFFITKMPLANNWRRKKIPSCSYLALPVDNAHNHSWVNLPDGRIALCAEYNRIFIYDPITNTFESVASTQYYGYLFTCGVFNCEIYDFRPTLIAMGITGDGAKETRFQIYDYTTDGASWTYSEY